MGDCKLSHSDDTALTDGWRLRAAGDRATLSSVCLDRLLTEAALRGCLFTRYFHLCLCRPCIIDLRQATSFSDCLTAAVANSSVMQHYSAQYRWIDGVDNNSSVIIQYLYSTRPLQDTAVLVVA